jgi:DNA replication protein DnaC
VLSKDQIINDCSKCDGTGHIGIHEPCECLLRFRGYNSLIDCGFSSHILEHVVNKYEFPFFELGEDAISFYLNNKNLVEDRGLSLYIYSKERGRGKTTLAHYIMFKIAEHFSHTSTYSTHRTYHFDNSNSILTTRSESDTCDYNFYVIDDLGSEDRSSSWFKESMSSKLQNIMQFRRNNGLPTIITSNY